MSIHNESNSPDARTVDPNRPFLDTPLPGLDIRKSAKPKPDANSPDRQSDSSGRAGGRRLRQVAAASILLRVTVRKFNEFRRVRSAYGIALI